MGAPKTQDGSPIIAPIVFPKGTFLYVAGAGDDPTAGRGEGPKFVLQRKTPGSSSVEWSFNDWVKAVGGTGRSIGGGLGDEIAFELYAPATTLEAVTPGEGSVILADTGYTVGATPLNIIVPVPPSTIGTHNVLSAVPIPASVGEPNFWAWSQPDSGRGTVVSSLTAGYTNGTHVPGFNLYDVAVPLSRQVAHVQIIGTRDILIDTASVEPIIILPHWVFRAELLTASVLTVTVAWELKVARMRTTKIW